MLHFPEILRNQAQEAARRRHHWRDPWAFHRGFRISTIDLVCCHLSYLLSAPLGIARLVIRAVIRWFWRSSGANLAHSPGGVHPGRMEISQAKPSHHQEPGSLQLISSPRNPTPHNRVVPDTSRSRNAFVPAECFCPDLTAARSVGANAVLRDFVQWRKMCRVPSQPKSRAVPQSYQVCGAWTMIGLSPQTSSWPSFRRNEAHAVGLVRQDLTVEGMVASGQRTSQVHW